MFPYHLNLMSGCYTFFFAPRLPIIEKASISMYLN